jgi:hypothetical protein
MSSIPTNGRRGREASWRHMWGSRKKFQPGTSTHFGAEIAPSATDGVQLATPRSGSGSGSSPAFPPITSTFKEDGAHAPLEHPGLATAVVRSPPLSSTFKSRLPFESRSPGMELPTEVLTPGGLCRTPSRAAAAARSILKGKAAAPPAYRRAYAGSSSEQDELVPAGADDVGGEASTARRSSPDRCSGRVRVAAEERQPLSPRASSSDPQWSSRDASNEPSRSTADNLVEISAVSSEVSSADGQSGRCLAPIERHHPWPILICAHHRWSLPFAHHPWPLPCAHYRCSTDHALLYRASFGACLSAGRSESSKGKAFASRAPPPLSSIQSHNSSGSSLAEFVPEQRGGPSASPLVDLGGGGMAYGDAYAYDPDIPDSAERSRRKSSDWI